MRSGKALHITQVTGGKSQTGVQFRVCWCLQGSWAGGRKRTGGNSLGGYAPGSGSRRKLGQRKRTGEAPGMLGNFLSMPHLALGTPSAVPPPDGCPGFTSESLTGQQGEKVNTLDLAPWVEVLEGGLVDGSLGGGIPWLLWGGPRMLIQSLLGSWFFSRLIQSVGTTSVLGHK